MNISVNKLYKTYGTTQTLIEALQPSTFQIKSGEQVAITGTSGSGKSTLLHLLGCLDKPTSGEICYDDQPISKKSDSKLSAFRLKNIGLVFQSYNLLPELTAYENIILPALLDGSDYKTPVVNKMIKTLGLSDRLDHLPGELSGGQQQRVAIARALVNQPSVLLCDEPTGNLDSQSSKDVINLLNDTAKQYGITLIIVTHDLHISQQYSRVITITDGQVGGAV